MAEEKNVEQQHDAAQEQAPLSIEEQQQKRFEYLRDQVNLAGFGLQYESELLEGIRSGKATFEIPHITHFGEDYMSANLNFSKSEKTGNYFFNSFDALLSRVDQHETLSHRFYRDNKITLKEAYNLLSGRAVHKTGLETKEGTKYDAWIQFDLSQKNDKDNYLEKKFGASGFDLKDVLSGYPIKEISPSNKNHEVNMHGLIESLKKGNLQTITFTIAGDDCKRQIAANPRFKNITMYDNDGQRLGHRSDQSKSAKQSENDGTSAKQEKNKKESPGDDEAPEVSRAAKRKSRKVGS